MPEFFFQSSVFSLSPTILQTQVKDQYFFLRILRENSISEMIFYLCLENSWRMNYRGRGAWAEFFGKSIFPQILFFGKI